LRRVPVEHGVMHIIDAARREGCECEVYGESVRRFTVEVHRGVVESLQRSRDAGIGVRVVEGGRVGSAYSSDLTPPGAKRAFDEARRNAAAGEKVDVDCLADNREWIGVGEELFPRLPSGRDDGAAVELVRDMERACLEHESVVNTEGAEYYEAVGEIVVASTRGFVRTERRGFCSCAISAIAGRDGEMRSGFHAAQAHHPDEIDFPAVGREAARRAVGLLGSRRIATKRYAVVIDGFAFTDIVAVLAEALSAEKVGKGMSPLAGRLGSEVARGIVTVLDDPRRSGACFNASFDAEGVPKGRRILIEAGGLSSYLYNVCSARRQGVEPPGNAVRESFKSRPEPGPSNLFLAPGTRSVREMVADLAEGIEVQNVMGIHTADTISGDFSVGISGHHIRGGTASEPIGEMTMSGTLLALLGGIVEVGGDLVFVGSFGSPTVLVDGISVSGT
jgi:PmbA protein